MDLSNLKPAKGSVKSRKRIARGEGSGKGGTATRGHKGQKSRSGAKKKIGFEGGQMPLQRRIPKGGFKNINRVEYTPFNLDRLQSIAEKYKIEVINPEVLKKHHIVSGKDTLIKILGNGQLDAKLEVHAHAFSKTAEAAIQDKGGKVVKL